MKGVVREESRYAIRTPLGWILMGPMEKIQSQECHVNVNFVHSVEAAREDDCLMQQIERFWAIENFRVTPDSKPCMSVEDMKALAIMEQSVKLEGGRYQVALPWKQFPPFLPYNRPMAERRLQALKKRFLQELFGNYKATMEQYLVKDHTRRATTKRASCRR